MAVAKDFNTPDVLRKLLICAVNVSTSATPEWEIQGYKIEKSSIEIKNDTSTMTDILGNTHNSVNKAELSQKFDPNNLRAGNKLSFLLLDNARKNAYDKMSAYQVLIIYAFLDGETAGTYQADMYDACTITVESLGGDARVEMPFEILYGGTLHAGTVDKITAPITFTPAK